MCLFLQLVAKVVMRRVLSHLVSKVPAPFLVVIVTSGIFWKPTAQHPHLLCQNLMYSPEARKGRRSHNRGTDCALHEKRPDQKRKSRQQKYPPAAFSPPILHLYHNGMTDADYQENGSAHNNSAEIHRMTILLFTPQSYGKIAKT